MRQLISFLLLTHALLAQKFSMVAATEERFLNFSETESNTPSIYIDEGSSLAWQNSIALVSFKKKDEALHYCQSLKLGTFKWSLPTTSELKSLSLYSYIAFGQKEHYFAYDTPVWDNRLSYGYDSKTGTKIAFAKDSKELYVRCVAHLED